MFIDNGSSFENGFKDHKEVTIKEINSIYIQNFRSLKEREIVLGKNITLISGKNGTMKSSILGLIAHPFTCTEDTKDIYGKSLKTQASQIFKWSVEKDVSDYWYYINFLTIEDINVSEPVRVYKRSDENNIRVVVGKGNKKGQGNFILNTSYLNFSRLYPIAETEAEKKEIILEEKSAKKISKYYYSVLTRKDFESIEPISDDNTKYTFGPKAAKYDFKSISSGEDNLGNIFMKMLAFEDNKKDKGLQGLLCIDEIEAGLHPIAQEKLLDLLIGWSKAHNIKIVATTHSLSLLNYAYSLQQGDADQKIVINMISTIQAKGSNYKIVMNPTLKQLNKELTLKDSENLENIYKVKVIFEDNVAKEYFNQIFFRSNIKKYIETITDLANDNTGNGCRTLVSIAKNGSLLLEDSIIIFDSDAKTELDALKRTKVSYLTLPQKNEELALEKEIAKYIFDLPEEHVLFGEDNHEKQFYDSELIKANLILLNQTVKDLENRNVRDFKNWYKDSNLDRPRILKNYIRDNADIVKAFKKDFVDKLMEKLKVHNIHIGD